MSANPAVHWEDRIGAERAAGSIGVVFRSDVFPLVVRAPRPFTDDELLELSAANNCVQIERNSAGELIMMTPVGGKTGNREIFVGRELDIWAEQQANGIAFSSNTGFSLPDGSVRAPDAAWLSSEKWNHLTSEEQGKFVPLCPDFVVEVRSPTDSIGELESKMADWIANGAQLAWLIDPDRKLAVIYRPEREPEALPEPESLTGEGLLSGFVLKMERLWRNP